MKQKVEFMRDSKKLQALTPILFAAALATFAPVASLAEEAGAKPATEDVQFDASSVSSFAGAFLAGMVADGDQDYANAIEFYKSALVFEPNNIIIQERLMINLFLNRDFDEGVALARDLKDDRAVERVTTLALGLDAIRDGEYDDARAFFAYQGANELDRMMNAMLIAWADFGEGKKQEAIKTVAELEGPDWFAIFRNYTAGTMAAAAGDLEQARKYLTEAVTDREGGAGAQDVFVRATIALASVEANNGEKQKAFDALSAGEAVTGRYAPFEAVRARIEKGEELKLEVRDASEGAASVFFAIGAALHQSTGGQGGGPGGPGEVVSFYLQSVHAMDTDSADALLLLGNIADQLGKPADAIEYYQMVEQQSPMYRLSELQLGLDLADMGKGDEARAHLQALIDADPSDFRSYLALGSVLSQAEDYAAMAKNYDAAVEAIGPRPERSHWGVFYQRGIAYERLKEWEKAEPNFTKALELFPDQPQVLNYLGYSWIDMNINLEKGLEMIQKAVAARPSDGYIVDSLGWAYYRLGRYDDAVHELERAVSLKENDATINDHLGDAYWQVGRKLEASFQWNRALIADPDEATAESLHKKLKEGLPPQEALTPPVENDAAADKKS